MFETFLKHYKITSKVSRDPSENALTLDPLIQNSYHAFLSQYGGATFNNGLYRLHRSQDIVRWNDIVSTTFPSYAKRIHCFGYDWLGRQFALDSERFRESELLVLMLEPGTGQALQIPETFVGFHNTELVEYGDAALASVAFARWYSGVHSDIEATQCVGYKVPLFLGGKDNSENFELTDLEVYWEICGQLLQKTG